jgi:hypothetical protein
MDTKSLAVVLIVEGINQYEIQFRLLTHTIRVYNPTVKIYAVTPSYYSISKDTKDHIKKYGIFHIDCPDMHDEVKNCEETILTDIIKPKSILLAKRYITEDYILYIDNDSVCFGDLYKILEQYDSGYFCVSQPDVLKMASNYVVNTELKFRYEAKQLYKLISNENWFDFFPTGWFILHPTHSDFWQKWVDHILYITKKVKNKNILQLCKEYIRSSILHLSLEASLYRLSNEFNFMHVDSTIMQSCYFNQFASLVEPYPVIYNYGGFNQYAYHISHIKHIHEFITINNIDITHTSRGPLDDNSGTVDRLRFK